MTYQEKRVLAAFASGVVGGHEDDCGVREDMLDALASLKRKGLVHRVWVLSPSGRKAAGACDLQNPEK